MVQTCSKCSRANPAEAVYCFHDGSALGGATRRGGPVAVGAKPFPHPFVFPTGRTARSFDELALACQEDWPGACKLLHEGFLDSFFAGMGRVDLVMAAKEAAHFPDPDRGLDQLLAKLPSSVLDDPKLHVDPGEVNLGLLDSTQERSFDLELDNQGMHLLYGTVSSSDVWLTLGDSPGSNEKHFHFTHDSRIKVHIWPDRVRASRKPIEAKILVESNTGPVTVKVRCEKPVKPFTLGPLAGCKTPRQVAEKAQSIPKDVAPLFEAGEVEKWYAANGWVYPVTVPAASGVAAIQQFFEALGVTRAPKVEISHKELTLTGDVGATIPITIEVKAQEKRPVFAHVTSNVPWLEVGKSKLSGRTATINLSIPSVPNRPGQTLTAELDVVSNGKQRFRVPVSLVIAGNVSNGFDLAPPPVEAQVPHPVLVADGFAPSFEPAHADEPAMPDLASLTEPRRSKPESPRRRQSREGGLVRHLIPAGLLLACVLGVVVYDWRVPLAPSHRRPIIAGPAYDPERLADQRPRVGVSFTRTSRFGVVMLDTEDPNDKGKRKKLTAYEDGASNNTIIRIGTSEHMFGASTPHNRMTKDREALPSPYLGWISTMDFTSEQVRVTQYVQIVPGADNVLDTVLIYYRADNYGTIPRPVAIRLMLDTYIGKNDGVPFTVPGKSGFVRTMATFPKAEIPDYLEVVENPNDPKNPGTIARLGLKGLSWGDVEVVEPEKVVICRFPGPDRKWDWEPEPMGDDSCVAVYWPEETLEPKKSMHVAVTYGLGKLEISDQLALSAPAAVGPGREFIVTAYVYNAMAGQKVTLDLPAGMKVDASTPAEQVIAKDDKRTQIFWKVRAGEKGNFQIGATSETSRAKPIPIVVQPRSIFG